MGFVVSFTFFILFTLFYLQSKMLTQFVFHTLIMLSVNLQTIMPMNTAAKS